MDAQDRIKQPLFLGRSLQSHPRSSGRQGTSKSRTMPPLSLPLGDDVFSMDGDSHLITIAPTDSDKNRSVLIPSLLTYPGPVVVLDPKGESYAVTARARREMGHTVLRLDPFHVIDQDSDALNPIDLISLTGSDIETDCQAVADLLLARTSFNDPWESSAFGLLSGVLGYIAAVPEKRTTTGLISTFHSDDVVYTLAVVLDTIGKLIPPMSFQEISSFLQKADNERSRILSTVTSHLKVLMSKDVLSTLDESSVPLTDILEGKPLSIYLILPPAKLKSHAALLRLWIGMLLHCITSRRVPPAQRTLFLLDECAQLDHFPALESAITMCRGYGLQIWTFWQDLAQIRGLYPVSWPTMIKNCGLVQVFDAKNYSASSEVAALLGIEIDDVWRLEPDEQIVYRDGISHKIKKFNYLTDKMFAGRFDNNPEQVTAR
jgi:type IV secretion system protein VirD4